MSMKGKACLVTGASSGIGAGIAILFAKEGASILLCGRNEDRLQEVLIKCVEAAEGQKELFSTAVAEMTNAEDRRRIIDTAVKLFGQLDVLVPCAGIMPPPEDFELVTEERYDTVMDTNLKSIFFLVQAAVPHLEKSKRNVVFISSILSKVVAPNFEVYELSKGALDHMCKSLAQSLGPKGIRVNSVNPGLIKTRLYREFNGEDKAAEVVEGIARKMNEFHLLHGRCATPEEAAQAVLFFASSRSNFVTGQILWVEAGLTLTPAAFQNR